MKLVLIVLALLSAIVATVLGFGWVDDPDLAEDWAGWLSLGLAFFFAAHLPLER